MTREQQMLILRDAHERTSNYEPFTRDELESLEAIPGVEVEVLARVRKGTILRKLKWLAPDGGEDR